MRSVLIGLVLGLASVANAQGTTTSEWSAVDADWIVPELHGFWEPWMANAQIVVKCEAFTFHGSYTYERYATFGSGTVHFGGNAVQFVFEEGSQWVDGVQVSVPHQLIMGPNGELAQIQSSSFGFDIGTNPPASIDIALPAILIDGELF